MTWWRRPGPGRHARRVQPEVAAARIGPAPDEPVQRGMVRLVFADGSAVALDPHDPRGRAFRALADAMLTPGAAGRAQGGISAADAHQETSAGDASGERGIG